jgi:hypothetical protein
MKTVPAHFETCGLSSLFIMTMSQALRAAKVPCPASPFGSRSPSIIQLRNSGTRVGLPQRKKKEGAVYHRLWTSVNSIVCLRPHPTTVPAVALTYKYLFSANTCQLNKR